MFRLFYGHQNAVTVGAKNTKTELLGQNITVTYFNYHAKAQKLIKEGHCIKAELTENHNGISPALVLYFDNNIPMPVRHYRFCDYFELLKYYKIPIDVQTNS